MPILHLETNLTKRAALNPWTRPVITVDRL